jgi:ABC-type transporter Mla maintaining outer membrane lipid asymmetry permease subunit MlaE
MNGTTPAGSPEGVGVAVGGALVPAVVVVTAVAVVADEQRPHHQED